VKTRLLVLVTDLALGGTPRSVESLVLGLDRTRFDVEVVTLLAPSPITENITANGIPCEALDLRGKLDFFRLIPLIGKIRRGRYDLVHTWLFHANLVGRALRPFGRFALLASERGVELTKSRMRVLLDRLTHRASDLVVVNAQAIRDVLAKREKIPRERVRVIENGVDLERFAPAVTPPPGPPRLICVARLDPIKAHLDLIGIMPRLFERVPGISLDLVGEGPMRELLEDAVKKLGISPQVRFLGARTDVPRLLAEAHLFVLPSRSEGMPGSVLEAMATGLPVVASRVGGVGDVVVDGQTGRLVPPSDPKALEEAIASVLVDSDLARSMGRAGLARIHEKFTRAAFIHAHEALYDEILMARKRVFGRAVPS